MDLSGRKIAFVNAKEKEVVVIRMPDDAENLD